jgi:23S rRNA pseudouridine955/2504/2580 synthase
VHAASSGHVIAQDDKYGDKEFDHSLKSTGINRLFLHAASISFLHPNTETTLRVEAPLEHKLVKGLEKLPK